MAIAATSNRLLSLDSAPPVSYGYDAAGNRITDNLASYTYDARGRLVQATSSVGTTQYQVNALGLRTKKSGPLGETIFIHDRQGRLIAEADGQGSIAREYVWLDDTPVAILDGPQGSTSIYAIHSDHLNTPRAVTNSAGTVVWRMSPVSEPFGLLPPEQDPDNDGAQFVLNLRFPGQYFDQETLTSQNYYRDCYDPQTGTYCQPDPIGTVLYRDMAAKSLAGSRGRVSPQLASLLYRAQPEFNHPYGYVGNAPTMKVDPLGLQALPIPLPLPPPAGGAANDPVFGPTHGGGGGCPPDCGEFKKRLDDTYIALQRAKRTSGLLMNATFNTLYETYFWVSVRNYEAQCGAYTPPYPQEPDPDSIHDFYGK